MRINLQTLEVCKITKLQNWNSSVGGLRLYNLLEMVFKVLKSFLYEEDTRY